MSDLYLQNKPCRVRDYHAAATKMKIELDLTDCTKDDWTIVEQFFPFAGAIFGCIADPKEGRGALIMQSKERCSPLTLSFSGPMDLILHEVQPGPLTLSMTPKSMQEPATAKLSFTIQAELSPEEVGSVNAHVNYPIMLTTHATQIDLEDASKKKRRVDVSKSNA